MSDSELLIEQLVLAATEVHCKHCGAYNMGEEEYYALENALLDEFETLLARRPPGWISVAEKLPGPDDVVLCAYYHARLQSHVIFVGMNEREGGEWWRAVHSEWGTRAVAHWMSLDALPAPPEPEG